MRKTAVIERKLEVCLRFPRSIVRSKTKIVIELVRLDHLAGIHLPVGIPCSLEFAEGLHQLRAEHFWQKLAPVLPVAVLSGERSAIADDQVGGFFDELAVLGDSLCRSRSKVEPRVHAGVAKVSIEGAFVAVVSHHVTEVT